MLLIQVANMVLQVAKAQPDKSNVFPTTLIKVAKSKAFNTKTIPMIAHKNSKIVHNQTVIDNFLISVRGIALLQTKPFREYVDNLQVIVSYLSETAAIQLPEYQEFEIINNSIVNKSFTLDVWLINDLETASMDLRVYTRETSDRRIQTQSICAVLLGSRHVLQTAVFGLWLHEIVVLLTMLHLQLTIVSVRVIHESSADDSKQSRMNAECRRLRRNIVISPAFRTRNGLQCLINCSKPLLRYAKLIEIVINDGRANERKSNMYLKIDNLLLMNLEEFANEIKFEIPYISRQPHHIILITIWNITSNSYGCDAKSRRGMKCYTKTDIQMNNDIQNDETVVVNESCGTICMEPDINNETTLFGVNGTVAPLCNCDWQTHINCGEVILHTGSAPRCRYHRCRKGKVG